jgi:hypothetical protein
VFVALRCSEQGALRPINIREEGSFETSITLFHFSSFWFSRLVE